MIRNNLFSKKNLQEILQICIIIILDCKKFFDSTFIFIILFARNSSNITISYYQKIHKSFFEFALNQNINFSSIFISTTSIYYHHDM